MFQRHMSLERSTCFWIQVNVTISCQDLIWPFAMFWAQHVVLVVDYAMDGLDCAVWLSLTFLYLLLSANVTLWIPLSSVAVDDVRELLLVLWLLYLVSVSIAWSFVERVRASTAKHVGWLNCLAGNVDLAVFQVSLQSPTSADYVSLQILIHDLVWDLGCSPQTLVIFLPRLLQRWTEVVHDCQHRISNEIDWVSAGWFHYYGPRMDFSAFFSMVPFLDHFWTIFGTCWALCKQRRIDLITPFSLVVDLWRHVEHLLLRRAELRQFRFPLHVHKHFENLSCILLALRSLTHLPGTWDPISLTPIPDSMPMIHCHGMWPKQLMTLRGQGGLKFMVVNVMTPCLKAIVLMTVLAANFWRRPWPDRCSLSVCTSLCGLLPLFPCCKGQESLKIWWLKEVCLGKQMLLHILDQRLWGISWQLKINVLSNSVLIYCKRKQMSKYRHPGMKVWRQRSMVVVPSARRFCNLYVTDLDSMQAHPFCGARTGSRLWRMVAGDVGFGKNVPYHGTICPKPCKDRFVKCVVTLRGSWSIQMPRPIGDSFAHEMRRPSGKQKLSEPMPSGSQSNSKVWCICMYI